MSSGIACLKNKTKPYALPNSIYYTRGVILRAGIHLKNDKPAMKQKILTAAFALCALWMLSGCASRQTQTEASEEVAITTYYLGKRGVEPVRPVPVPPPVPALEVKAAVVQGIVYFDFDKHNIKPEYQGVIEKHAKVLNDNPALLARVEGNTDVFGTDEYNTPLGLLRANEVRSELIRLGVRRQQLEPVSYSFHQPAFMGRDADSRAKNRRVEISYQN